MRTYTPKAADITRTWHILDAEGQVLGRLATEAATLLRGKHKVTWAPHMDGGDHVIVINASALAVNPRKLADKRYYRHSGYPGGIKERSLEEMLRRRPEEVIRHAVKGMLPRTRLGRKQLTKLKVYAGPDHPHVAQKPTPMEIET